jgi:hypothetical protein
MIGLDNGGQGGPNDCLRVGNGQADELGAGGPACPMIIPSKRMSFVDAKGFEETVAIHEAAVVHRHDGLGRRHKFSIEKDYHENPISYARLDKLIEADSRAKKLLQFSVRYSFEPAFNK